MITIAATARCHNPECDFACTGNDWAVVDRAAEKHVRAGHATAVEAVRMSG